MKNLSKNLSYSEAIHSDTAVRRHINNEPNAEQLAAMVFISNNVFQPMRDFFGYPIRINSFFRSLTLNRAIGGSRTSQHCSGEAFDIRGTNGVSNADLFNYIVDNLDFDQLIWEFGTDSEPRWVHVSLKKDNNRGQILKAVKVKGKTIYKILKY